MRRLHKFYILLALVATVAGCQSVRPYQRVYLNDHEMQHGKDGARVLEESMQTYREGAVGGDGNKTSGGCGCN